MHKIETDHDKEKEKMMEEKKHKKRMKDSEYSNLRLNKH